MDPTPPRYEKRIGVRQFTPPIPAVVRCTEERGSRREHLTVTRDVPATVLEASVSGVRVTFEAAEEPPRLGSPVWLRLSGTGEATGVLRRHVDWPPHAYAIEIVQATPEFYELIAVHLGTDSDDLTLAWRLAK